MAQDIVVTREFSVGPGGSFGPGAEPGATAITINFYRPVPHEEFKPDHECIYEIKVGSEVVRTSSAVGYDGVSALLWAISRVPADFELGYQLDGWYPLIPKEYLDDMRQHDPAQQNPPRQDVILTREIGVGSDGSATTITINFYRPSQYENPHWGYSCAYEIKIDSDVVRTGSRSGFDGISALLTTMDYVPCDFDIALTKWNALIPKEYLDDMRVASRNPGRPDTGELVMSQPQPESIVVTRACSVGPHGFFSHGANQGPTTITINFYRAVPHVLLEEAEPDYECAYEIKFGSDVACRSSAVGIDGVAALLAAMRSAVSDLDRRFLEEWNVWMPKEYFEDMLGIG